MTTGPYVATDAEYVACDRCDYIGPANTAHDSWDGAQWQPCKPFCIRFDRVTGVDFQVIRQRDGECVFSAYSEVDCRRWIDEKGRHHA